MALADDITAQKLGEPVEVEDDSNRDQCMDWAFFACDRMGIPREAIRHLYASQVFNNPNTVTRQFFDLVPNRSDYVPPANSLAVWFSNIPGLTGIAGHIAWVLSGSTKATLRTSDQNWNAKLKVTINNHTYPGNDNNVQMGFLVPKVNVEGNNDVPLKDPISADDVNNLYLQLLGRPMNGAADGGGWVGSSWHDAYYGIKDSAEGQAYMRKLLDAHSQVESQQEVITDLSKDNTAFKDANEELQRQLAVAEAKLSSQPPVQLPSTDTGSQTSSNNSKLVDQLLGAAKAYMGAAIAFISAAAVDPTIISEFQKNGWKGGLAALFAGLMVYVTKNKAGK